MNKISFDNETRTAFVYDEDILRALATTLMQEWNNRRNNLRGGAYLPEYAVLLVDSTGNNTSQLLFKPVVLSKADLIRNGNYKIANPEDVWAFMEARQ